MCSKIAAKLMNSSEESSIGSAVYFSNNVFTENLREKERVTERQYTVTLVMLHNISDLESSSSSEKQNHAVMKFHTSLTV